MGKICEKLLLESNHRFMVETCETFSSGGIEKYFCEEVFLILMKLVEVETGKQLLGT